MKYLVQVNRRYLVSIEADSALAAEHALLDLDGVAYANAFDSDLLNTDTFRGVLLDCDTVSLDEISTMSGVYASKWNVYSELKAAADTAAAEERRLHDELEKAIERRQASAANALRALKDARNWQTTVMGLDPEDVR